MTMASPLGKIYVPPSGPTRAKLILVGEAPGQQEEILISPFVGGSGQVLNQSLAQAGLPRSEVYVTNVVKFRPFNNDFGGLYEDKKRTRPTQELLQATEVLLHELSTVESNVIVPLGDEALRAVTGRRGISKWRGSILSGPQNRKVVPTYHPAYVLRQWESKVILDHDIRRAVTESASPHLSLPTHSFLTRPSLAQTLQYLTQCDRAKRVAFDIETHSPHPYVRCLGLSCDPSHAISIPLTYSVNEGLMSQGTIPSTPPGESSTMGNYWSTNEEREIISRVDQLFRDPSIQKVAQNAPFDVTILGEQYGLEFHNLHLDTMLCQHTCYSELPKGLDFLCSMYTRVPYYSDYDCASDLSTWTYNCYDAAVTLEISYVLEKEMDKCGVREFYFSHVHPTMWSVIRMQSRGVKIHRSVRKALKESKLIELATLEKSLQEMSGDVGFNPSSPKQVGDLLYDKLHLREQFHHKTRKRTVDQDAIINLKRDHPAHSTLLTALASHSTISTLVEGFLGYDPDPSDLIYTSFNVGGTVTRRLSSTKPLNRPDRPGSNLQNVPTGEFRRMFIARDGYTFLKCDLSQAEFRVVVWLARITRFIDKYAKGDFDVHRWAASKIFSIPESSVTYDQRKMAKNGVYGGNYEMHPKRASMIWECLPSQAKFILEGYHRAVPEIAGWWSSVRSTLERTRKIVSPTGGIRVFLGRLDDSTFREAYSHSCQSVVGDVINRALWLGEMQFPPTVCRAVLQVHDELLYECRTGEVETYAPLIKANMEWPIPVPGVSVPLVIPTEISVGPNWYDQKPWKPQSERTPQ